MNIYVRKITNIFTHIAYNTIYLNLCSNRSDSILIGFLCIFRVFSIIKHINFILITQTRPSKKKPTYSSKIFCRLFIIFFAGYI